jgi:hypothetical protein
MTDALNPPVLKAEIPDQVVSEGASYQFFLGDYVQSPDEASGNVQFYAELADGQALPAGVMCMPDGMLTGLPANGTQGRYDILVMAENDSGIPLTVQFVLTIKERIKIDETSQHFTQLKAKIWEALGEGLPLPDLGDLLNRPITHEDIAYLLERFATLKIWDVYNLDPTSEPVLLNLPGVSKHYNVYDRGCYIVAAPKDLYNEERTSADALITAKAMAAEVHKRGWTVEFTGFAKMAKAAWVELQVLGKKTGKEIEVIRYDPDPADLRLIEAEVNAESVLGVRKSI